MTQGGIKQQTLSAKIGKIPGREANGAIRASGKPIRNPGRIAGGAPDIPNEQFWSVHAPNAWRNPLGSTPGGIIDKKQQIDPEMTAAFAHPNSGGRFRSTSSQVLLHNSGRQMAIGIWNGFVVHQGDIPASQPHERPPFFRKTLTPPIKTQFGAHASNASPPPDTAFHRQPQAVLPRPLVTSVVPTEKLVRGFPRASFQSFNRLVSDPNNSDYGFNGRWGQLKRSANHQPPTQMEPTPSSLKSQDARRM